MVTSTTPWLNAAQQRAWRSYLAGTTVLNERLDRDLRDRHKLSLAEYEILVRLSEAPDKRVRMAELAAALAHSRSRITHTISRLERMGVVERLACDEDGRGVSAALTAQGSTVLEEAAHTHVRGVDQYLIAETTAEELALLGTIFERIRSNLRGTHF